MKKLKIHSHNAIYYHIHKLNKMYFKIHNLLKSLKIYFNNFDNDYEKLFCILDGLVPNIDNITDNRKELMDNIPVFTETFRYINILLNESQVHHSIQDIAMLKNIIYVYVNYKILYNQYHIHKNRLYNVINKDEIVYVDTNIDSNIPHNVIFNPYYIEYLKKNTYNDIMFNDNFLNSPVQLYKYIEIIKINKSYETDKIILGSFLQNDFLSIHHINIRSEEEYIILIGE